MDGALLGSWSSQKVLGRQLCKAIKKLTPEFITIYYGADTTQDQADRALEIFTEACPDADVNLIAGGQPVYYFMISAE